MQKKKIILKRVILLIVSIFFLLNFSFATTDMTSKNIVGLVNPIIDLINIIWIPFVVLAGKLYTNWLVYGGDMHLDVVLWNIWNFSKTIANFAIWFILVWSIFWLFIWKTKNIFSILWKITIATILINASWFIIWVLIDVSTILLASVGSFPMHIMWTTNIKAQDDFQYCKKIIIQKPEKKWNIFSCSDNGYEKKTPSDFFKQMNNISWPLFFIWASILNIDKPIWIDKTLVSQWKTAKVVSFSTMVYFVTLILFIVPIILLIIIWVIRIFWIWIYIAFSPLIFLDQVFGWKLSNSHKAFKFSNMIWLVFIPVTVTFAMWIAVIFLSTLKTAFVSWWDDPAKKVLWIEGKSMKIWNKTIVTVEWNTMNKYTDETWWFFWKLILIIMSSILLWSMLRLVFKSSEITSSISEWVYRFAEQSLKTVPILPIWKEWTSIWALEMWLHKWLTRSWFNTRSAEQANKVLSAIKNTMWFSWWDILSTEIQSWKNKIQVKGHLKKNVLPVLWDFILEMKKSHPDLIPMQSPNFQEVVALAINQIWEKDKNIYSVLWLKKTKDWKDTYITDPKEMFNQDKFKVFVAGIIYNTKNKNIFDATLSSQGFNNIYANIKKWADASFLANNLKNI